jgi:hypothetical protein
VLINDVLVENEHVDCIGMFKSESKEKFIKVDPQGNKMSIIIDEGLYVNKLDKGVVVFNLHKEDGYRALTIDKTNKGAEAQFWINDFLGLRPASDSFHSTGQVMEMTREFITKVMPEEFDVSKVNKAEYMNRSVEYFKNREVFQEEEFVNEVFVHKNLADSFGRFKNQYEKGADIEIGAEFDISKNAVKKKYAGMRSVLKLDRNFHVYIHGDTSLIENGYDEASGKKYYKLYYDTEQ